MFKIFSVPVDHTFFLANFCTASLASSSSVGVLPKQHPAGAGTGNSTNVTAGYPVSNVRQYDNKKINGNQGPVVAQPGQQVAPASVSAAAQVAGMPGVGGGGQPMTMKQNSHSVRPQVQQVQAAQSGMNGIGISEVAALTTGASAAGVPGGTGGNTSAGVPGGPSGPVVTPGGGGGGGVNTAVSNNSFSGIYNDSAEGLVDNYLVSAPVRGAEMSNGMYGQHELVAAISQITVDQSGGGPGQQQQQQHQNKAFSKAKKLWSAETASNAASADQRSPGQTSGPGGVMAKSENDVVTGTKVPRGFNNGGPGGGGGGRPPSAVRSGGGGGPGGAGGRYSANQGNEMNIPNDGASDSLSSTSEAEVAGGANAGDPIGDNGKPLSFARIASLNLEKQAIGQKPPKNMGEQGTLVPSSGAGM